MRIPISQIRTDGGTQTRAGISQDVVADYAAAMEEGAKFPPAVVFHDGKAHWLADGFHRIEAEKLVGYTETEADVKQGTRRDAVLFSLSANAAHGLRRTNADKRRAVEVLLSDAEWAKWSDREIDKRAGVGNDLVGAMRKELQVSENDTSTRKGSDGKNYPATRKPKKGKKAASKNGAGESVFVCDTCGDSFDLKVWHCASCGHHWPADKPQCSNCEKYPPLSTKGIKETYSDGLSYCVMAISQMKRIHRNDTQREAAFQKMRKWLDDNE